MSVIKTGDIGRTQQGSVLDPAGKTQTGSGVSKLLSTEAVGGLQGMNRGHTDHRPRQNVLGNMASKASSVLGLVAMVPIPQVRVLAGAATVGATLLKGTLNVVEAKRTGGDAKGAVVAAAADLVQQGATIIAGRAGDATADRAVGVAVAAITKGVRSAG